MRHQDKDPWSFPHHCFDTPSRTWTHWIDFLKWVVGAIILVLALVQVAYAEVGLWHAGPKNANLTFIVWGGNCENHR